MKTRSMRKTVFAAPMMACALSTALATTAFADCTQSQDAALSVFDVPKFQSTYPVKLAFDNVGDLKPGAVVKMAGVPVGRVGSISLDQHDYQALVVIDLGSEYHFPKDTEAKIVTAGLPGDHGGQYIALVPGGDGQMLAAGDTIDRTQSAIMLEDLIGKLLYSKMADAGDAASQATAGTAGGQGQ